MANFKLVTLSTGRQVCIDTDKIVAIEPVQNYCQIVMAAMAGNSDNLRALTFTVTGSLGEVIQRLGISLQV